MAVLGKTRAVLVKTGDFINTAISFIIFSILDIIDLILCFVYKIADFALELEWKPCYCSSTKEPITKKGKIFVSENGESSRIVSISPSKLRLEEISDTLYTRHSMAKSTVTEFKRWKSKKRGKNGFLVNSTVVEVRKTGQVASNPVPRWSDCDCKTCHFWASSCKERLFVHMDGVKDNAQEDVLFIHGFISSSSFWTETLFPNFSESTKSMYRLFAVDLLGFGRSPKPNDSLYTLKDHLEMIERSVIEPYGVKSFHIVAHSLGCILALALAVKYPGSVKSLTLIAPPYFPIPKGEQPTQYLMRKLAPRRVWPLIAFGASLACWYEHVSRTICLLICKNHRLWNFLIKLVTQNRIKTYLIEGFCCHTHNAAWHTLHNIICGTAGKIDAYMEIVKIRLKCHVTIIHGQNDELIPVECSYNVQSKIPRARVKVVEDKDHITIVVGRQKEFAKELEEIWKSSRGK